MKSLKSSFWNVLVPLFLVYIFLHIGFTTWKLFKVDDTRNGYQNVKDGPLLLKSGLPYKNNANKRNKNKIAAKQVPKLKDVGVPKIVNKAKEILISEAHALLNATSEDSKFIYVAMINKGYERLTMNWICNTAQMDNVHNRTLIITMDPTPCAAIKQQWDNTIKCAQLGLQTYKKGYDWGKQEYINILTLRANVMHILTSNDIPYVLFETDATWFRDPLPLFRDQLNAEEDFDIMVPVKGYDGGSWDTLAFDPMLVANTNGSKTFMEEMKKRLNEDHTLYDQDVLNQQCSSQHNGLICRQFDYSEVADGKWYKMDDRERTIPYILNNNFNSGIKNKETKQALNGFWFLATKDNQCIIAKVAKFMKKYS